MKKSIVFLGLVGFALAASAQTPADPVKAAFDRMLDSKPATVKVAAPKAPAMGEDPLRAAVMAVLWKESAYHAPVMAQAPVQRVR